MIARKLVYIFFSFIFVLSFFGFIDTAAATTPQNNTPAISANAFTYTPMEQIPGQSAAPKNFYEYVSYLYKFGIAAVGIAALLMITIGGFMYITSAGNNARMENAKGVITDAIAGLVLALSAYLILYTINPELVRIRPISVSPITGTANTPITSPTGIPTGSTPVNGTSPMGTLVTSKCPGVSPDLNLCATTTCSKVCTNLTPYNALITTYASQNGLSAGIVKAVICRESGGNKIAVNTRGALPSCGLMQVNISRSGASCSSDPSLGNLLDPETNIREGTRLLAQKNAAAAGFNYASVGITPYHLTFAAYNCCANGQNPNSVSADCGPTVPKWACALNPGTGAYNMCAVHDYACDVQACAFMY